MYYFDQIKAKVRDILVGYGIDENEIELEIPPENVGADVAWPVFVMAKKKKRAPLLLAQEIVESFTRNDFIEKVEAIGPYINFYANRKKYNNSVAEEICGLSSKYGSLPKNTERIGIEYLSPNTNKALTVGHCRNGSLGKSLVEIYRFAGFEAIPIVLFNDRGVHICKSMLAYQKWGEGRTPESMNMKSDHFVGYFYVMFGQMAEKNEELLLEAQEMLQKWEEGEPEVRNLWKKMNKWCFDGMEKTLQRVGIHFEKKYLESEFYQFGREIVQKALTEKKVVRLPDGAVEADLTDIKLDKKILLRKDGTTVYIVQDLYLAKKKIEDLNLDRSVYVVGEEQKYHFEVLFELLDRFGIANREDCYHLAYAMVKSSSGKKMSSRTGEGEKWDELLDEMKDLAKFEIKERDKDVLSLELDKRAEIIAQSALKFVMLNQDVRKAINFDRTEAVRFEGETGPYLLYTYARMTSIINKYSGVTEGFVEENDNKEMNDIFKTCSLFSWYVKKAAESYNPSVVSRFAFELSQKINNFYHKYRVADHDIQKQKLSRLIMLKSARQVLENCFRLLGMEYLEKM